MLEECEIKSRGIYYDYRHFVEMEKNNPHGLGDYPRRMIILDDNNQEEKECADEQRQVKEL